MSRSRGPRPGSRSCERCRRRSARWKSSMVRVGMLMDVVDAHQIPVGRQLILTPMLVLSWNIGLRVRVGRV